VIADHRPELVAFAELVGPTDPVTPVGGRTDWDVGGAPQEGSREVRAPSGVVEFEPAEMTVTCGAGTPVRQLQERLQESGQRVALPARGDATVGGVLAVGRSSARRLGDGLARDTLLQLVYVDSNGVLVRNGGPTVKNVSGFDLCKLMVGSLGTLGLLAEVTLRCLPVPERSQWFESHSDPFGLRSRLYRPVSILWDGSQTWVLLEGNGTDVDQQASELDLAPCPGPPPIPTGGHESLRPGLLEEIQGEFMAEIGVGVVHRPHPVPPATVEPGVSRLCAEIKRRFDPSGRLNPGRSVLA
jgi:hypothetical protein